MNEAKHTYVVELPKVKRTLFLVCCLLISAGYLISAYGNGASLPTKLAAINATEYFAACNALQSMGMMLLLPLAGKLCEIFGSKTIVVIGIVLQLVCQIGLALCTHPLLFTVLYCLVGCATGLYVAMPYTLISDVTEPRERPKLYGALSTANAIGCLIGPLGSGQLIRAGLGNAGFIFYIPVSIIALIGIAAIYPSAGKWSGSNVKYDFGGLLLLLFSVCSIVIWLSLGGNLFPFTGVFGVALLVCGIIFTIFLVKRELQVQNPAVPIAMFKKKRFTTAFLCQLLAGGYSVSAASFVLMYAMEVMQVSASLYTTVTIPQTIVQAICGMVLGSWIGKKFAQRVRTAGLLAMGSAFAAMIILCLVQPTTPFYICCLATAIGGIGQACIQSAFPLLFQTELQPQEVGAAMSMYTFSGPSGVCLFSALFGLILTTMGSYNAIFILGAISAALGLLIAVFNFKLPEVSES